MDEHGQKIQNTAESMNQSPIEMCDKMSILFQTLNSELNVSYDRFIRTTEADHKLAVYDIFEKCLQNGDVYLGEYEGWYENPKPLLFF
jgi:methionyl-tRNA synthetase